MNDDPQCDPSPRRLPDPVPTAFPDPAPQNVPESSTSANRAPSEAGSPTSAQSPRRSRRTAVTVGIAIAATVVLVVTGLVGAWFIANRGNQPVPVTLPTPGAASSWASPVPQDTTPATSYPSGPVAVRDAAVRAVPFDTPLPPGTTIGVAAAANSTWTQTGQWSFSHQGDKCTVVVSLGTPPSGFSGGDRASTIAFLQNLLPGIGVNEITPASFAARNGTGTTVGATDFLAVKARYADSSDQLWLAARAFSAAQTMLTIRLTCPASVRIADAATSALSGIVLRYTA